MLITRGSPQVVLALDIVENNQQVQSMLVAKNPHIPLVPNFPKDKQGEGGDGFGFGAALVVMKSHHVLMERSTQRFGRIPGSPTNP
jgi:hypothetical protein